MVCCGKSIEEKPNVIVTKTNIPPTLLKEDELVTPDASKELLEGLQIDFKSPDISPTYQDAQEEISPKSQAGEPYNDEDRTGNITDSVGRPLNIKSEKQDSGNVDSGSTKATTDSADSSKRDSEEEKDLSYLTMPFHELAAKTKWNDIQGYFEADVRLKLEKLKAEHSNLWDPKNYNDGKPLNSGEIVQCWDELALRLLKFKQGDIKATVESIDAHLKWRVEKDPSSIKATDAKTAIVGGAWRYIGRGFPMKVVLSGQGESEDAAVEKIQSRPRRYSLLDLGGTASVGQKSQGSSKRRGSIANMVKVASRRMSTGGAGFQHKYVPDRNDKAGPMVIWGQSSFANMHEYSLAEHENLTIYLCESILRRCLAEKRPMQIYLIMDPSGYEFWMLRYKAYTKLALGIAQSHYGGSGVKFWIVRPPSIFRLLWNFLSVFMAASTTEIISFHSSLPQALETMREYLPMEVIPDIYGGEAEEPFPLPGFPDETPLWPDAETLKKTLEEKKRRHEASGELKSPSMKLSKTASMKKNSSGDSMNFESKKSKKKDKKMGKTQIGDVEDVGDEFELDFSSSEELDEEPELKDSSKEQKKGGSPFAAARQIGRRLSVTVGMGKKSDSYVSQDSSASGGKWSGYFRRNSTTKTDGGADKGPSGNTMV